ncbi:MAG TPA: hypothetical protein VFZ17_05655 [Acidimicrobiia bacterium]|nr:hypothetical protein [Acidimicrobiia bacterium]
MPDGWVLVDVAGPWPFVSRARFRNAAGDLVEWRSRHQRKRHSLLDRRHTATWWAPDAIGWWIGVLFAIGSACFAVGAAPGYVGLVGVAADGITFFVGSIFFTTASALQYLEVLNADPSITGAGGSRKHVRFFSFEPRRVDWWASAVQLVGTVFFNVSTFSAMWTSLTAEQADRLVWKPNVYGCVCFLVASGLAWGEVGDAFWSWRPRDLSWWIAGLNLLGSIAFAASAVAAKVVPGTEQVRNVAVMNLGTFLGGVAFLVGAVLLLPERTHDGAGVTTSAVRPAVGAA